MPGQTDGGGRRPAGAHSVPLAGRAALAVVLFLAPGLVGVVAEVLLPVSLISITQVLAALVAVTLTFGLIHALILMKINRSRWRARLPDLLPYLVPPALLGLLAAAAPGWHPTSTTVIAGMAAFVACDAAWFAIAVRHAVRAPAQL
jgi:hypothetical protein